MLNKIQSFSLGKSRLLSCEKKIISSFSLLLVLSSVIFYSCSNDNPTTTTNNNSGSGTTQTLTSNDAGNISFDGFKLVFPVGTVPLQQNGTAGTVVFSMNTTTSMPSGLNALPSGYTQMGKILQAGPDGFVFNNTIRIYLPSSASSPTNLYVMGYIPEENGWKIIPSNSGTDSSSGAHYMFADVLKLGYFVIVQSTSDHAMFLPQGGVQYCAPLDNYVYTLTVQSVTFQEPGIAAFIAGGMVGRTFVTPTQPGTGIPIDYCRGIVPLGTYSFWVSRRLWTSNTIET